MLCWIRITISIAGYNNVKIKSCDINIQIINKNKKNNLTNMKNFIPFRVSKLSFF